MQDIPIIHDPSIDSLTVAVNYVCNSRCSFCFIERELGLKLPDTSWDFLRALFAKHVAEGQPYRRLILSGAEATLRKDLPDIARAALAEGGFEVVQIQTNGRQLRTGPPRPSAGSGDHRALRVHPCWHPRADAVPTKSPHSFRDAGRPRQPPRCGRDADVQHRHHLRATHTSPTPRAS